MCRIRDNKSYKSHGKLLLKVIQQRIVDRIDKEVSQQQSAFRPGTGTRESIFNLRAICERSIDVQKTFVLLIIIRLLNG